MQAIKVVTSKKFESEKKYIFDFVFNSLGLQWILIESESDLYTELHFNDKCILRCSNEFWIRAEQEWLSVSLIPSGHTNLLVPSEYDLGEKYLPIFYGVNSLSYNNLNHMVDFGFDLFGTIFFLLTGYEERVQSFEGERFPFKKSILCKFHLIERPLVDEYIWLVSSVFKKSGVEVTNYSNNDVLVVSCDVDNPFLKKIKAEDLIKNSILSCIRTKKITDFKNIFNAYTSSDPLSDPYVKGIFEIMNANERIGSKVTFNFIPLVTSLDKDGTGGFGSKEYQFLFKSILEREHKIGLHPGFLSYADDNLMRQSFDAFHSHLDKYLGPNNDLTGRQHYLNWVYSKTDRLLCENNLYKDSTLGFAESIGFRCGTSRQFKIYDYELRCQLDIYEQPLIVMEDSLISKRYMGLGYSDLAFQRVLACYKKCKKFGGKMTLLWHNCHLGTEKDIDFYHELLAIK
jgi:hypothetical protein